MVQVASQNPIKREVMQAIAAIPNGRVTTYSAIADHLRVIPRYVVHVLSQLDLDEQLSIPWHRVVGCGGRLGRTSRLRFSLQREILESEGVTVDERGNVSRFEDRFVAVH